MTEWCISIYREISGMTRFAVFLAYPTLRNATYATTTMIKFKGRLYEFFSSKHLRWEHSSVNFHQIPPLTPFPDLLSYNAHLYINYKSYNSSLLAFIANVKPFDSISPILFKMGANLNFLTNAPISYLIVPFPLHAPYNSYFCHCFLGHVIS